MVVLTLTQCQSPATMRQIQIESYSFRINGQPHWLNPPGSLMSKSPTMPDWQSDQGRKNRVEQATAHLRQSIDSTVCLEPVNGVMICSSGSPDDRSNAARYSEILAKLRSEFFQWANALQLNIPKPQECLVLGLCSDQNVYEKYLQSEGMDALTGSLGTTHPVRLVSVVLTDRKALRNNHAETIAAHETLHQFCLISELCPAWEAWPRWLHEGIALLGDHSVMPANLKPHRARPKANSPFGSVNQSRLDDWKRIANGFDLKTFMQQDMLKNSHDHQADYAASWALTYGLAVWKNGVELNALLNFLEIQALQPVPENSIEMRSAEWLTHHLGDQLPAFLDFMKSM